MHDHKTHIQKTIAKVLLLHSINRLVERGLMKKVKDGWVLTKKGRLWAKEGGLKKWAESKGLGDVEVAK